MKTMKKIFLNNGYSIPSIGLGTVHVQNLDEIINEGFKIGYELIDTAANYGNEREIGKIIKDYRNKIFIISKIQIFSDGYENTILAVKKTLKRLNTSYIDLMLIHQPYGDIFGEWRALEMLYKQGVIKAIGVSNFSVDRLMDLCLHCKIKPSVNQVELHPYYQQKNLLSFCKEENIVLQAWSPLGQGKIDFSKDTILMNIANNHGKTVQEIILRWDLQNGVIPLPRTHSVEHLKSNFDIFNFNLSDDEMKLISSLDKNHTFYQDHNNKDIVKLLSVLVSSDLERESLNVDENYLKFAFGKRYKELSLSGTQNTRYLSKYNRNINNLIIRSDCLDFIDSYDCDYLKKIGVTDILDLRKEKIMNNEFYDSFKLHIISLDNKIFADSENIYSNCLSDMEFILVNEYMHILSQKRKIKEIFTVILNAEGKIIISCKNGIDKTGIVSILIHLATGADFFSIVQDYMRSIEKLSNKIDLNNVDNLYIKKMPDIISKLLTTFKKKYTDIESYLFQCGIDVKKVKEKLLI